MSPLPSGITLRSRGTNSLILVTDLSDEIKAHIERHFAAWCFGIVQVEARPSNYTFSRIAREFLLRYETKASETKLGMIGELLVHVVASSCMSDLESFGLYFNKEEKSIKKGFDLTFFESERERVWYAEVKTGLVGASTPPVKAKQLVQTALTDLSHKLGDQAQRSRWDSALMDVAATLYGPHQTTVRDLLHDDIEDLDSDQFDQWAGLASGTVIHPHSSESIDAEVLFDSLDSVSIPAGFDEVKMVVIQKSTIEKVVDFLREAADA